MSPRFSELCGAFIRFTDSQRGSFDAAKDLMDATRRNWELLKPALQEGADFGLVCVLMESMRKTAPAQHKDWATRFDSLGAWAEADMSEKEKAEAVFLAYMQGRADTGRLVHSTVGPSTVGSHATGPSDSGMEAANATELASNSYAWTADASQYEWDHPAMASSTPANDAPERAANTRPRRWEQPACTKCPLNKHGKKHPVSECWVDHPEMAPTSLRETYQQLHRRRYPPGNGPAFDSLI
jgi:hypothetical protein